jgi:hypothetical protein
MDGCVLVWEFWFYFWGLVWRWRDIDLREIRLFTILLIISLIFLGVSKYSSSANESRK